MSIWQRLRVALVGYPLVVSREVVAHHARQSGHTERAMRAAFRQMPPERQNFLALMTEIDMELDAALGVTR